MQCSLQHFDVLSQFVEVWKFIVELAQRARIRQPMPNCFQEPYQNAAKTSDNTSHQCSHHYQHLSLIQNSLLQNTAAT